MDNTNTGDVLAICSIRVVHSDRLSNGKVLNDIECAVFDVQTISGGTTLVIVKPTDRFYSRGQDAVKKQLLSLVTSCCHEIGLPTQISTSKVMPDFNRRSSWVLWSRNDEFNFIAIENRRIELLPVISVQPGIKANSQKALETLFPVNAQEGICHLNQFFETVER
jgi:hypothetical protein